MSEYTTPRVAEAWMRPIKAHAEETVQGLGVAGDRRINWMVEGEHRVEDLRRLMTGMACEHCLQTFPAVPRLTNLAAWKPYLSLWEPAISRERVRQRIVFELCPVCAKPVKPEFAVQDYLGTVEGKTPIETAAASFYEEQDHRHAKRAAKDVWVRTKRTGKG